jgi:hypothetical protein
VEPVEWILAIAAVIGAATAGAAAYSSGRAQAHASNYAAQLAEQNAITARQQADARQKQQDRDTKLRLGAIRANQGAFGGANEGSALDVLGDTASQLELARQNIAYAGELQARGYDSTAILDEARATNASRGGAYQAGASLLGGSYAGYAAGGKLKQGGAATTSTTSISE